MTQLLVREGTPEDIEPVLRAKLDIHRECYPFRGEEVFQLVERGIPQNVGFWEAGMGLGMRFHVALDGDAVVGMSGARPTSPEEPKAAELPAVELQMLYLHKDYRGRGAADLLLAAAIGRLPAHLWVLEGNARAIRFYEKHGFRLTGERETLDETWALKDELRMVRGEVN
ncbi:GNAT family N-acetyltransferase [Falsarthrobacter nasiphocae]|uniref:Ribosomal protein S18 acetylase RimI-like enzyme n=1 Tax=Falsarthrobacter nasiphocae TaxID=189863 RepID=A0AAE3YH53_9MICC|nr:GNAT family N-acetyltransferase [Falsarthrobacter nasiphocae]MDR6891911.1 ribosomal protein S18 acetylase RimI-like enzyme [Falsarthrobacter nasiphocae]